MQTTLAIAEQSGGKALRAELAAASGKLLNSAFGESFLHRRSEYSQQMGGIGCVKGQHCDPQGAAGFACPEH